MNESTAPWYLLAGTIAVIASLTVLPIAAFVALYCSYRVYRDGKGAYGYLLFAVGVTSLALWTAEAIQSGSW